jgi:hypothetical protein
MRSVVWRSSGASLAGCSQTTRRRRSVAEEAGVLPDTVECLGTHALCSTITLAEAAATWLPFQGAHRARALLLDGLLKALRGAEIH